jgi:cobalt/nickel transport system permease protein
VATPREAFWAFAVDAVILLIVALAARVSLRRWARRCLVEVPFLLFAVFLPFVGTAPYVQVGPLLLSEPGLWGAWNIAVKGTLGVAASALLTATTTVPDLATFMIRYGEVLAADLARMRIARVSRGDDPRWLWQVRGLAQTAGALFVRSYERGERVYVAMLARGYGFGPVARAGQQAPRRSWARALSVPAAAAVVCAAALTVG